MKHDDTATGNRLQAFLDHAVRPPAAAKTARAATPSAKPAARRLDAGRGKGAAAQEPRTERLRQGETILVGAHLPPDYNKQLRMLAAEESTEVKTLIREALDLLFVKKGKDRIIG